MPESAPIPILNLRGQHVLIDADLARLYGVPTKRLNEQVRRNLDRFPADFLFELTSEEKSEVVANCDHLKNLKFSKALPHAFTEHGALMAANVLNSTEAVKMSVFIIPRLHQTARSPLCQRDHPQAPCRDRQNAPPPRLRPARPLPKTAPAAAASAGQTPSAHRLRKSGGPMTVKYVFVNKGMRYPRGCPTPLEKMSGKARNRQAR
jgi:hypothetical protein